MPTQIACNRCNGTGLYSGTRRDGSTYQGACFACQGGGPRFARRRAYAAAGPARAPVAPVIAPVYTPRQQASLDAFAVAQPQAWVWLVNNRATSDFAASLLNGVARYGNLTPRQLACVMRNVEAVAPITPSDSAIGFVDPIPTVDQGAPMESTWADRQAAQAAILAADAARPGVNPDGTPIAVEPAMPVQPVTVNLDRVRAAMESARASGLRKVALTFGEVTMKYSGPSFRAGNGMILCYWQGSYCGFVNAGNDWRPRMGANVSPAALDAFRAVGSDPQAAARTHGLDTGNCSCCRRLLTDPVSVMAGIGPVCIRRFGWSF